MNVRAFSVDAPRPHRVMTDRRNDSGKRNFWHAYPAKIGNNQKGMTWKTLPIVPVVVPAQPLRPSEIAFFLLT